MEKKLTKRQQQKEKERIQGLVDEMFSVIEKNAGRIPDGGVEALVAGTFLAAFEGEQKCQVCKKAIPPNVHFRADLIGTEPKYCSVKCRDTAKKRRYRAKAKAPKTPAKRPRRITE